ncbi:hypothetical protein AMIS_63200 [Actinoplanes missouriensis 431]|uniref:Uncharacterized protein n=1 Tax=Actinoplanes missouriensis (strain ATCC 14538 / DSM 43046 / CBS 188.64 / JCM 3121 / NBRC 102363 / NCIMB 12654 / NRRL B-3342 / UNCC 431) TaxID=512565 RepID=I0HEV3_ACTM4|nr:hypothetical protein [Actinoplanes missouriensis]BAL91540.1 hypothetical protein AMIS_63200 [Actinoplanes missouriensis 431]
MLSLVLSLLALVLILAGLVMIAQGWAGRRDVGRELARQHISFPAGDRLPAGLARFAGADVRTGVQARAYSEMIAANVAKATGGRSYAEIADECMRAGHDEKLARLRETAFMGQSLRGALLGAYQAWQVTLLVMGLGALFLTVGAAFLAVTLQLG